MIKSSDTRRSKSPQRPGGNGIDAYPVRPHGFRQITYTRFQCSLGNSHCVVAWENLLCAVISHGNDTAVSSPHERRGFLGKTYQRVNTYVHGKGKTFP